MNTQRKKQNPIVLGFFVLALLVGSIVLSSNAFARHQYFWLFAKSGIQSLGPYVSPPSSMGLNEFTPLVGYFSFFNNTNLLFDERPDMQDYNEVDLGGDDYRLFARARIRIKCTDGLPIKPTVGYKLTDGGTELGIYDTTMNPLDVHIHSPSSSIWIINYVLSGKPHDHIELVSFHPVQARTNKFIYQGGTIITWCTPNGGHGNPQITVQLRADKSSDFPTHNVALWTGSNTPGSHVSFYESVKRTQLNFYELWRLDPVPAATSF